MNNIIQQYLYQIILAIFLALAAYLGTQAKNLWKKYVNTEIKKNVIRSTVRYIEQVYQDIHGPAKLAAAMKKASEILAGYGITISESELVAMIEAAVNEFNNAFSKATAGSGKHETGAPAIAPAAEDPKPAPETAPTMEEIIADLKDAE